MKLISKNIAFIISAIAITVVFFSSRLYNLMILPIFTDEAIYTRWSQIALNDANWRFISLTDGKQPSFVWAQLILMRFFDDPLLAGRMVSVFSGFGVLVGLFFLAQIIFKNTKISLLTAFLYAVYPFALVYDRLALYESILAMFFVWSLYFQILLVRTLRLDIAMILGFILGGGVLTKSSGFLTIYMMPLLFFLLDFKNKIFKSSAIRLFILVGVSILIANVMYAVLRLSPFFYIIEEKNSIFVYPVGEWLAFDLNTKISNFLSNFNGLFGWFVNYFSIPFTTFLALAFIYKSAYKEKLLLFLWFLLPFGSLLVFGKTLYPRYIFFMTLPLLPLVAYGFFQTIKVVKNKIAIFFIALALFVYPLYANYFILNDFANAPIPESDREQLISGWPAGGGVRESIEFFKKEAENKKIFIATQGTFGLMPYSYEIYLNDNPNIEIKGYWPIEDIPPAELVDKSKNMPVYVVFYQSCPSCASPGQPPDAWKVNQIKNYKKGEGDVSLGVYRFISE